MTPGHGPVVKVQIEFIYFIIYYFTILESTLQHSRSLTLNLNQWDKMTEYVQYIFDRIGFKLR